MAKDLIIQYTNLLHRYKDINAPKVKQFISENSNDELFLKRAATLNKIFKLKDALNDTNSVEPIMEKDVLQANQLHPHTV